MDQRLKDKLTKRREEGTLRSLSHFEGFVDFFSNDYLGLSRLPVEVSKRSGGTGSRLISGNSQRIEESERKLADFFNAEAALMYNSGYDANLGLFSTIPQRGDTILFDELIHASVRDGIRLSFANSLSFKHNDVADLESKLKKVQGTTYVAIESLYSMDGDMAPLRQVAELCEQYGAYLIVDEAHAAGVFGETGKGLVHALDLSEKVFIRLVTFGKAYGSHGACVLCSKELRDFQINFARSFIYTTALPEHVYVHNADIVAKPFIDERRESLQKCIQYFRNQYKDDRLMSAPNSPIQILKVGNIDQTRTIAQKLQDQKIAVKPIYSPTVSAGSERIRLCFHAFNTMSEVDALIAQLS